MKLRLYQVDAFTDKLFSGNPAAVIPLKKWAMENNLAENVFFVPSALNEADYDIRWFTPVLEINLCGHATLASAFVIFTILKEKKKSVTFSSKSVCNRNWWRYFTGYSDRQPTGRLVEK